VLAFETRDDADQRAEVAKAIAKADFQNRDAEHGTVRSGLDRKKA
jgi:hypothetical protein